MMRFEHMPNFQFDKMKPGESHTKYRSICVKVLTNMSLRSPRFEGNRIFSILVVHREVRRMFKQVLMIAHKWISMKDK